MFLNVRGFASVRRRLTCPSLLRPPDLWLLPWAMEHAKQSHTEITEAGHRERGDVLATLSVASVIPGRGAAHVDRLRALCVKHLFTRLSERLWSTQARVQNPEATRNSQARDRTPAAHAFRVHIISLDIFTIMIYAGSVFPGCGGRDAQATSLLPYDVYETRALTNISGKITES